jgi:hypothetical protein
MHQAGLGLGESGPGYDDGRLEVRPRDYVALADGVVLRLTRGSWRCSEVADAASAGSSAGGAGTAAAVPSAGSAWKR